MKQVLVLGAGFSHAVSGHMPMTSKLAGLVMDRLRADGFAAPHGQFTGTGFEHGCRGSRKRNPTWMTPRTWRTRALFLRVSRALRHVMLECQKDTSRLRRLVGALHYSHSTVLTFNYDMLIEATVGVVGLARLTGHLLGGR